MGLPAFFCLSWGHLILIPRASPAGLPQSLGTGSFPPGNAVFFHNARQAFKGVRSHLKLAVADPGII